MEDLDEYDSRGGSKLPKAYDVKARDREERKRKREEGGGGGGGGGRGEDLDAFPVMMSFKAFLETQDDYITDEEALYKYGEYKLEFKRQKLNEFFVLHKGQEWFRARYHPLDSAQRHQLAVQAVRRRCDVFQELMGKGFLEGLCCDMSKEGDLVKFLDSVVILLEGGTYEDIKNLDNEQNNNEKAEAVGLKHKTSSLFIKALPALLTREDLLEVVRRYPGFLRAATSEADPRNHFSRRCWLSFERNSAKIREICFALNNVQVKGFDLAPLVNKDLTRRIRPANDKFAAEASMRRDLAAVCRIAAFQDGQAGLWAAAPPQQEGVVVEGGGGGVVANKNPLLAEAESLPPDEEEEVKSVLDKLLLYLRVVHSIDYYNQNDYKGEDEMPNRCGLMHVRPAEAGGGEEAGGGGGEAQQQQPPTDQELDTFWTSIQARLEQFTTLPPKIDDAEAKKLGLKDEEFEIGKFISANSQELAKDKWLCTLSGKKFKALEFVKKHIFNKFADKVDTVKKEVEFFNNYIRDPRRPQLPDEKTLQPAAKKPAAVKAASSPAAAAGSKKLRTEELPPMAEHPHVRRSIHERLGTPRTGKGEVRITYAQTDPRSLIDYSDVDNFTFDIFG